MLFLLFHIKLDRKIKSHTDRKLGFFFSHNAKKSGYLYDKSHHSSSQQYSYKYHRAAQEGAACSIFLFVVKKGNLLEMNV